MKPTFTWSLIMNEKNGLKTMVFFVIYLYQRSDFFELGIDD